MWSKRQIFRCRRPNLPARFDWAEHVWIKIGLFVFICQCAIYFSNQANLYPHEIMQKCGITNCSKYSLLSHKQPPLLQIKVVAYRRWSLTGKIKKINPMLDWLIRHILKMYTCQLFFSRMCEIFRLHRIWISEDIPTASEDCRRFRKTFEDHRRFPTASKDFPMTFDDNWRCRKICDDFKTGPAWFPKDFQPISSVIKEFRRCSHDFLNVRNQLNFI